jgi:hypothetical protein
VEFSTVLLWKSTISQKSGSFNSTAVGIYTFPEEWNFQQHPHGNLQYLRREEASTALLWESTIPQKSGKLQQHCYGKFESLKHFSLSNIRYRNLKRRGKFYLLHCNSEMLKKRTWKGRSRLVVANLL